MCGYLTEWALSLALATFENIEVRKANPKGQYNKCVGETRYGAVSHRSSDYDDG